MLAATLIILLSPSIPRISAQPAKYHIKQAGFRVLYMAPAFMALEKGFFAQEGVDFQFTEIDSGALGPAAVISGNAQVSDLDPLGVAEFQAQNKSLILFYNLVNRVTLDLIVRNQVIQRTWAISIPRLPGPSCRQRPGSSGMIDPTSTQGSSRCRCWKTPRWPSCSPPRSWSW